MKISTIRLVAGASVCAAVFCLAGCAGDYGGTASDPALHFAAATPAGISSAWREGGVVWIVPTKNTMLDEASDEGGKPVKIEASGSYLSIASASPVFRLRVDGSYFVTLRVPLK